MEDRLRKFATLVDCGNFTKAARVLHISQPALTMAINKLERELGVSLLTRDTRTFELTAAGQIAYRSAQELSVVSANLRTRLAEQAQEKPRVTIGMIDSLANMFFASNASADLQGQLDVTVIVNNSRYLLQALNQGEIDIAYVTGQSTDLEDVVVDQLGSEPMVLVCRASHSGERQQQLNHRQAIEFIAYDRPSTSFKLIDRALQARGISTTPIFYSSSPEVMLELVRRGQGCSVLPYFLVKNPIFRGDISIVHHPDPIIVSRPIISVTRNGQVLPDAITGLTIQIQSLLRAMKP